MGLAGWFLFGGWGFNKPTAPSAAIRKFTKQSNSITGLMKLHYFTGSGLVFLNVECVKIHLSISELVQICCCRKTTDLVSSTNSNYSKFIASLDDFSQELRIITAENKMMLEESTDHCQQLLSNLKNASRDTDKWAEFTTAQIVDFTNQQLLSFSYEKQQLQCLQKVPIVTWSLIQHFETGFNSRICRGGKFSLIARTKLWFSDHSRLVLLSLNRLN